MPLEQSACLLDARAIKPGATREYVRKLDADLPAGTYRASVGVWWGNPPNAIDGTIHSDPFEVR